MEVLILLSLILMNGVFALSEMAVVSSRKARLQQMADEGRPGAAAAIGLATDPSNFLSTIQVGITLIGVTSGAFGEAALSAKLSGWLSQWPAIAGHAGTLSIVLVVAGITMTSLIIGELVPKRLALLDPEAVASLVARPMQWLARLAFPVVRILSLATDAVLRLLRLGRATTPPVTEEEIQVLMQQGARAGIFQQHEEALVSRIFRLDQIRVAAIMTPRADIVHLDLESNSGENVRRIVEHGHSRFPVTRGGLERIEGVVMARRLLADALAGKPLEPAALMAEPLFVPAGISTVTLMEQFTRHRQTMAFAVDEYGAVEGLVTLNDVMEALVGDIATAEGEMERDLVQRADGSWLIGGSVAIDRLKAVLGIKTALPGEKQEAYHTAGGFMMRQLGRVPRLDDSFTCLDWKWEIVDMDGRRVDKLLASPVRKEPTALSPTDRFSREP